MIRAALLPLVAILLSAAAPAGDWRPLDPRNTLLVDTSRGRVVVEMRPEFAPQAVERVKRLAREGVYDGLQFHRVIDGFVAQTGNPDNRDGGVSTHPDLPAEFSFHLPADGDQTITVVRSDGVEGLLGATPFAGVTAAEQARGLDRRLRAWGAYCAGVVGMGRQADPGSANSEIFFMRDPARRLDHDYAVWGRVVDGLEVVRALQVGEPPARPDIMVRVRLAADLPPEQRPRIDIQDPRGPRFRAQLAGLKRAKGAAFSICDIEIAVRRH